MWSDVAIGWTKIGEYGDYFWSAVSVTINI